MLTRKKSFISRIFIIVVSILYLTTSSIQSIFATNSASETLCEQTGSCYYDGSGGSTGCYGDGINIGGSTIEEKIWSGLTTFLTPEQAAGVMGNMAHESNYFNPAQWEGTAQNKSWEYMTTNPASGAGIGLIQWSGGRRVNLLSFISNTDSSMITYLQNKDVYSPMYSVDGNKFLELAGEEVTNRMLQIQLEFLKDELTNNSAYSGIFDQTTVSDAAYYFLKQVERPANPNQPIRAQDAQKYYDELNGKSLSSSDTTCSASGEFAGIILSYAHPKYYPPKYIKRMSAYAEAVSRRMNEGKYVGGSIDGVPGIDCGGFVTAVIQDSGLDPNYNGTGYNSNTITQERYAQEHWELIASGSDFDTSILQPGDVAFTPGHTFVFVGDIPGFESNIASASYSIQPGAPSARAPMAGHESLTSSNIKWYRKKE